MENCEDSLQANTREERNARNAAASKTRFRQMGFYDAALDGRWHAVSPWVFHTRCTMAGEVPKAAASDRVLQQKRWGGDS